MSRKQVNHTRNKRIGGLLRELRLDRGWTQKALAAQFGVSIPGYQKWENGKTEVTAANLQKLASIYSIPIERLISADPASSGGVSVYPDARAEDAQEITEILQAVWRIDDAAVRRDVVNLLKSVGEELAQRRS